MTPELIDAVLADKVWRRARDLRVTITDFGAVLSYQIGKRPGFEATVYGDDPFCETGPRARGVAKAVESTREEAERRACARAGL